MATINNVWDLMLSCELPKDKFVVMYGNEYHGDVFDNKETFLKNYKLILKRAFNTDVTIYFNGKRIRSIINFNQMITNKTVRYYQQIIKY